MSTPAPLFTTAVTARWTGTRALAIRDRCPHCDGEPVTITVTQLPLLRGAGYGEAVTITVTSCRCRSRLSGLTATNPRLDR